MVSETLLHLTCTNPITEETAKVTLSLWLVESKFMRRMRILTSLCLECSLDGGVWFPKHCCSSPAYVQFQRGQPRCAHGWFLTFAAFAPSSGKECRSRDCLRAVHTFGSNLRRETLPAVSAPLLAGGLRRCIQELYRMKMSPRCLTAPGYFSTGFMQWWTAMACNRCCRRAVRGVWWCGGTLLVILHFCW